MDTNRIDQAAAEIAARTAEIQARHPHLAQPGQLAASLRAGLAQARAQEPVQIDLAGLPDEEREEIEDAAEDVALASGRCESARDDLVSARIDLASAQMALEAAEHTYQQAQRTSDHAQSRQAAVLRGYGLVITATGYARRRI